MRTTAEGEKRDFIYIPPNSYLIIQFVRDVCQALAAENNSSFNTTQVIDGLAGFLNVVAQATAHQLNRREDEFLDKHETHD